MRSASRGMTAKFEGLVQNYSGLVVALVVLFLVIFFVGMATAPNFLTVFNLKTIVRDAALVGIMAIGLTFVTLSGNFFLLSLKETAALSIIAFATSMSAGYGFEISFLFTMVIAISDRQCPGRAYRAWRKSDCCNAWSRWIAIWSWRLLERQSGCVFSPTARGRMAWHRIFLGPSQYNHCLYSHSDCSRVNLKVHKFWSAGVFDWC